MWLFPQRQQAEWRAAHHQRQLGELNATRCWPALAHAALASESKNGKRGLNLKVAVGAPGHSNLVPHQQKCCCVISKGRAFQPPTSHLPTAMGSSRTRKTVGFKSNSNSKPLHPLIQNQSTPRRDQVHGCAQLSSVLLLVWLVWHESSPKKSPWEPNRDMPDRPDLRTTPNPLSS